MLVPCYGYCMEMILLLIHLNYQYIRSMLRLLHDVRTNCTISSYKLGTILCLIVTVNMEFYIIEIIARDSVFWNHLFIYWFRFFAFPLTLHFGFLSVSTYLLRSWASQICCSLQFAAVSSAWTETHMPFVVKTCSFITATLVNKCLLLCSIRCHNFSILYYKNPQNLSLN